MQKCKSYHLSHISIEVVHIEMTRPDHSILEIARIHFLHNLKNFSLKTRITFLGHIFTIKLVSSMIPMIFLSFNPSFMINSHCRINAVVHLFICLLIYLFVGLSVWLFLDLNIGLFAFLFVRICPNVWLNYSVCLSASSLSGHCEMYFSSIIDDQRWSRNQLWHWINGKSDWPWAN